MGVYACVYVYCVLKFRAYHATISAEVNASDLPAAAPEPAVLTLDESAQGKQTTT